MFHTDTEDITLGNKIKVWAYDATTLDLINNEPFPSISAAADSFNVNYRTINRHLDTKVATKQNKMSVYFFKFSACIKFGVNEAGREISLCPWWNLSI